MINIKKLKGFEASRLKAIIKPVATTIVILLGLLLAAPLNIYPSLQKINADFNLLDGSWKIALPAALAQGEVAGRDFIFTYGALYQVTHGVGLLVPPGDIASVLRFQYSIEVTLVMLGVWFVLGLTNAPLAWRAAFYLLWAYFWHGYFFLTGGGLKPLGGLFWVAAGGYVLTASTEMKTRVRIVQYILTWALAPPVLLLYAFDVGVMTFSVVFYVHDCFVDRPAKLR